jgi:putative Ca2+/H+ antiporter (TMEM165/GDT1 family)
MPAFFLALIASVVATLAAREAVRVARLSAALGGSWALLPAIWLSSIGTSAFAAWLGAQLALQLPAPAKPMLVALALAFGAIELIVLRPRPAPREPTRSFVAIVLVMLATQGTDAARLLVLALAASRGGPWLAGAGGALGSGVVLTVAWALARRWEARLPLRPLRWTLAALMLLAAVVTGLNARGLLG